MNCKDEVLKEKYINNTIHSYTPQIYSLDQTVLHTISIVQNKFVEPKLKRGIQNTFINFGLVHKTHSNSDTSVVHHQFEYPTFDLHELVSSLDTILLDDNDNYTNIHSIDHSNYIIPDESDVII